MVTVAHLPRSLFRWPTLSVGLGHDIDLLVLSNFLWGVGSGFYTYLLPLYIGELGAAPAQIGFVLAVSSVVQAVVYIPAGLLADRLGHKPLMLFGWSLGPAAMVIFGLAASWQQLLVGVAVLAAVAWCSPAYHSYIAAAAGPRHLPYAFTIMFVGVTLGTTLSAPLGGWLGQTVGLRWLFAGAFAGYVASTLVVVLLRPQSGDAGTRRHGDTATRRGELPLPVGEGWGEGAEPLAADASTPSPQPSPTGRGSLCAPAAPAPVSPRRRVPAPEIWSGRLAAVLGITATLMFAANLAQPLAPNWLADTYGFSAADIGSFGGASALGGAALAIALGRLQHRRGAQWALPAAGLGLLAYAGLLLVAGSWLLAAVAYVLRGVFNVLPSLAVALVAGVLSEAKDLGEAKQPDQPRASREGVPGGRRMGLGFALYNTASAVAATLSTYAAGWLYGWWAPLPFLVSAALLAPLLWIVWLVAGRIARPPLRRF